MRAVVVGVLLSACGRLGFDATPDARPPLSDAALDLGALACEVDQRLPLALPTTDALRIARFGGQTHIIGILHITATQHDVRIWRLTGEPDAIAVEDRGLLYQRVDMAGLSVVEEGDGNILVLGVTDPSEVRVLRVDANAQLTGDSATPDLSFGLPPLARSTSGAMLAGVTGAGEPVVQPVDATFAPSAAATSLAAFANFTTIAPAGADFVVGWSTMAFCQFARVNAAGAVIAGPLTVDPPNGCTFPAITMLEDGTFIYVVHDEMFEVLTAHAGTIDSSFAVASTPQAIGASNSIAHELIARGTTARIVVNDNTRVRILDIDRARNTTPVGADLGTVLLDDTLAYETVDSATLLLRPEAGQLVLRRLCR